MYFTLCFHTFGLRLTLAANRAVRRAVLGSEGFGLRLRVAFFSFGGERREFSVLGVDVTSL
jgi:hypothetical protein